MRRCAECGRRVYPWQVAVRELLWRGSIGPVRSIRHRACFRSWFARWINGGA